MKNIIRYCGLLLVGLVSCMEDEAPSVELNVALDKQVYQVGEPVTFKLNGNPDNIVFYSGEVGHNYAYKERYHADGDLLVKFNSWVRYGDIYHNLKFLVSSDFSGIYDKENVEAATWIDLSDKFRFSVGDDQTPSRGGKFERCMSVRKRMQSYLLHSVMKMNRKHGRTTGLFVPSHLTAFLPKGYEAIWLRCLLWAGRWLILKIQQ